MAVLHGWNIYARNYRRPGTELDIVMEKNGVLSIVEVKLRNGPALVESMLAPAKRQALVRGAYQFLAETFYQADIVRFDLAVVGVKNGRAYLRLYKSDVFQA